MQTQVASDEDLMRAAQNGQPQRFGELIRRYRVAMLRFATGRLGSSTLAEDAVQETFLAAFRARHTFDARFRARTWLWTILVNECRRVWDRRRRMTELETEAVLRSRGTVDPSPEECLIARESRQRLERFLGDLPVDQAQALRFRFYEGLTFREVAQRLGVSLSTAKNRVRSGLEQLAALCRPADAATQCDRRPQGVGGRMP